MNRKQNIMNNVGNIEYARLRIVARSGSLGVPGPVAYDRKVHKINDCKSLALLTWKEDQNIKELLPVTISQPNFFPALVWFVCRVHWVWVSYAWIWF